MAKGQQGSILKRDRLVISERNRLTTTERIQFSDWI